MCHFSMAKVSGKSQEAREKESSKNQEGKSQEKT
jgi:hypothetical protein